ncbi:MAG TPA: hypothetical protein VGR63_19205 [Casimicrobiaceae bacterium]|jgi:hypothetical protein|nr:hypothetical protein [Casimicrobiaceae bacterium]
MPTNEDLLRENAALRAQIAAAGGPVVASPFIAEQPGPASIPPRKTWQVGPSAQLVATRKWLATRRGKSTPDELAGQIAQITTVINSGVNSAGYGDKRTEFRSLSELQQILNGLEEDLAEALGGGGRIRQIRMTTQADKGL